VANVGEWRVKRQARGDGGERAVNFVAWTFREQRVLVGIQYCVV